MRYRYIFKHNIILFSMQKRGIAKLVVAVLLLSVVLNAGAAVTCPRGYDVDENGRCYLETKEAEPASFKERCLGKDLPPECCQFPDYVESPACPYHEAILAVTDSAPDRPFSYSESTRVHESVYDCLKKDGPFDAQRAVSTQKSAEKCIASGDCTLQRNADGSHNCGIQDKSSTAGRVWSGIAGTGAPSSLIQEVKAANNYGWYDFAAASLKVAKGKEAADAFAQDLNTEKKAAEQRQEAAKQAESQEAGQPLSTRFSSLESRATPIPWKAFDSDNNEIPEVKLEGNTPISLKAKVDKITNGQPFSQEMPKDSLLQKAIMVPAEPINGAEMTFTLNAKPVDLKMPDPDKYDVKSTFGLELTKQGQEVHPLSEALFYIKQPGGKLLRYDEKRRDWTPLESQNSAGGFVAKSPGNSYFAIVVDKTASVTATKMAPPPSKRLGDWWFIIAILIGAIISLIFFQWRKAAKQLKELRR